MSDFEVRSEELEELSWGPRTIELIEPLGIEVEINRKTGFTKVYAETIEQSSDGPDYNSAIMNLGIAVEDFYTSFTETPRHARDTHSSSIMDVLIEHLPDEVIEDHR